MNVDPHVWGPGTGFKFRSLTSYTMYNVEELLLLGCADKNFSIMYSNSMSRVWDPGQSWFVNSYFSTECSIIYHCILFTCPSIAYTTVGYYYDVKHEVLAANFKHTSVLNLHYMIVLATMLLEWKVIMLRSGYWEKVQVEHPSAGYTLYGVIEMVEWAARHRLHHSLGTALVFVILLNKCMVAGQVIMELHLRMSKSFTVNKKEQDCNWLILVPTETIGGRRASNTSHRYFDVNISINSQGIDAKEEWREKGIAAPASHRRLLLLENMTQGLLGAAKTPADRKTACTCLKSAASAIKGINVGKAAGIPRVCGVNIPYKISPSTDCSKSSKVDESSIFQGIIW
ncbi:hypothetical protein H5410_052805 [Solanum commersonii]|uniref:Bifunctional inhibitor/plant lipid transfer protein/seed storage helical domain-containing protein n=1 Tax=Solanum commersonii TaxID=4109 RepID=A0A9J5X2K4_SOLCO|nr:hypothetical protein H5410_052805 [Solanum commersonii]